MRKVICDKCEKETDIKDVNCSASEGIYSSTYESLFKLDLCKDCREELKKRIREWSNQTNK